MSTSKAVREAWYDKVWVHKDVQSMTARVFLYDVSVDSAFNVASPASLIINGNY